VESDTSATGNPRKQEGRFCSKRPFLWLLNKLFFSGFCYVYQALVVRRMKPFVPLCRCASAGSKNMAIMLPHFGGLCRMAARFATKSGLTFSCIALALTAV
jgi:hypothetical protein